jgi:hypothetical protein
MFISKKALVVIGVLFLVIASAGLVYAQVDEISACVHDSGKVRFITERNPECRSSETLVTWNIQGEAGPAGPPGPPGAIDNLTFYHRSSVIVEILPMAFVSAVAECDPGDSATGGGYELIAATFGFVDVTDTLPGNDDYTVWAYNSYSSSATFRAWVVCADLAP